MISQKLLADYIAAQQREADARRLKGRLRFEILRQACSGARVQKGPLTYRIEHNARTSITRAKLLAAVGQVKFNAIMSEIEPTVSEQLIVFPKPVEPPADLVDEWDG